jgi:hypothetical protein
LNQRNDPWEVHHAPEGVAVPWGDHRTFGTFGPVRLVGETSEVTLETWPSLITAGHLHSPEFVGMLLVGGELYANPKRRVLLVGRAWVIHALIPYGAHRLALEEAIGYAHAYDGAHEPEGGTNFNSYSLDNVAMEFALVWDEKAQRVVVEWRERELENMRGKARSAVPPRFAICDGWRGDMDYMSWIDPQTGNRVRGTRRDWLMAYARAAE